MQSYTRKTGNGIWVLRSLFLLLTLGIFFAFRTELTNLGYFLIVSAAIISVIVTTSLTISETQFQIRKHYFFGLIPRIYRFSKKDKLFLYLYGKGELIFEDTGAYIDHEHLPMGCLYFLATIFFKPKSVKIRLEIRKTLPDGKKSVPIDIFLNKEEIKLIKKFAESDYL